MAYEREVNGEKEYVCGECGFRYETREIAEQCESWCREHQSCNIEITSYGKPPES